MPAISLFEPYAMGPHKLALTTFGVGAALVVEHAGGRAERDDERERDGAGRRGAWKRGS